MNHSSLGVALAWVLLILAAVVGTTMVVVGMVEELLEILRAWARHMKQRHP